MAHFTVRLVAYDKNGKAVHIGKLALDANNDGSLTAAEIEGMLGTRGGTVAAIVTFHEPTELTAQTASYALTVNGILQTGGA